MDFDTVDPPVFARKSAPPPPPPTKDDGGNNTQDNSNFSTPSSSLLDSTNDENSSAAANSFVPTPSPSTLSQSAAGKEDVPVDMEGTNDLPAPPNFEEEGFSRKARNRSHTKRTEKRGSAVPDVPKLLASLENGDLPPPPIIPSPLPIHGDSQLSLAAESGDRENDGKNTVGPNGGKPKKTKAAQRKDEKTDKPGKGEKEKKGSKAEEKSTSSQRTSARIPKIKQTDTSTHNRQWKVGDSSSSTPATSIGEEQPAGNKEPMQREDQPGASGTSGYGTRQQKIDPVCLDISSF